MRGLWLLSIFIGIPLIEIALFVQVGGQIGLAWTIVIVVATAIAGTMLLRMQGLAVMGRAQDAMRAGDVPVESLIDGLFLLIAGILLLTPGFLTDFIGFLFFVPAVRQTIGQFLWSRIVQSGSVHVSGFGGKRPTNDPRHDARPGTGPIIEGEIIRDSSAAPDSGNKPEPGIDEQITTIEPRPGSPWRQ